MVPGFCLTFRHFLIIDDSTPSQKNSKMVTIPAAQGNVSLEHNTSDLYFPNETMHRSLSFFRFFNMMECGVSIIGILLNIPSVIVLGNR